MMNLQASFFVRPNSHECISAVINLQADPRPALIGTVTDENGKPASDAFITLYQSGGAAHDDVPVATTFTDNLGRFAFAPLEAGKLYEVHVYKSVGATRTIEING